MHHLCKVRCRAVIVHDGKLLVVKNSRGSDYYALPGGHLDPHESPETCMARELKEELGVEAQVGRLLFVYTFTDKEEVPSVEFLFEIQNGQDFLMLGDKERSHAFELSEVRWIDREETINLLPKEIYAHFLSGTLVSDVTRFLEGKALDNSV